MVLLRNRHLVCAAPVFTDRFPQGLEDVSKYPDLIEELLKRGWTKEELRGILRENLLRVFKEVENVRVSRSVTTDF